MDPVLEQLDERTEKVAERLLRDVRPYRHSDVFIGNRTELFDEIYSLRTKLLGFSHDVRMAGQSLVGLVEMAGYPEEAKEIRILWADTTGHLEDYPSREEPSIQKIVESIIIGEDKLPVEEQRQLNADFEVKRLTKMREVIDKKLQEYRG